MASPGTDTIKMRIFIQCQNIKIPGCKLEYLQHQRNNSQKLPVTSELLSIVYLLPPSQSIVDPLVICEWSSFLPVEKVICYLIETTYSIRPCRQIAKRDQEWFRKRIRRVKTRLCLCILQRESRKVGGGGPRTGYTDKVNTSLHTLLEFEI